MNGSSCRSFATRRRLALLLLCLSATLAVAHECAPTDTPCLERAYEGHPARLASSWLTPARRDAWQAAPAPAAIIDFLTLDNQLHGWPERPRAAVLEPALADDIATAIAGLPAAVRRLAGNKLIGIWFVDELGGTGFTDTVRDAKGQPVAGYMVFDAAVLRGKRANSWATWKENTPFRPDPAWRLEARIEDDANDNRAQAIQYILLHELGHIIAIGSDLHARWDVPVKQLDPRARYRFADLSWQFDAKAEHWGSRFDADFKQRRDVVYYLGAKLDAGDMAPTYAALARTDFPTLYAATSPGDDFAESFASYVHHVLMGRPWRITLTHADGKPLTFDLCWDKPRCAAKRRVLEALLAPDAPAH